MMRIGKCKVAKSTNSPTGCALTSITVVLDDAFSDTRARGATRKAFGAKPGMRGSFVAADLPGVNLTFSPAPAPVVGTRGRAVDHIGFEIRGLEAFVKTSGKTGLHIFVPIERTLDFDAARQVCEMVGRHLLRQHPKDITMDWAVDKRTGKIFIDYNMNVRGKTLNVAYSPRGVPGAPVSVPLTWEELAKAYPLDFRITTLPDRLEKAGDRWQNALRDKQGLEKVLFPADAPKGERSKAR